MNSSLRPAPDSMGKPIQWRSLAERDGSPMGGDEFPLGASGWAEGVSRRRFLELMAASLALAGGTACTKLPREEIVPYVKQPEGMLPGRPLYFATSMDIGGEGYGALVRSDSGRPTKIEGNPDHPASLGRSGVHHQAALLTLYDPARSQTLQRSGRPATWEEFLGTLNTLAARWKDQRGAGVRLLTRHTASPTFRAQVAAFLEKFPNAYWHEHDPAFARSPKPAILHLEKAEVIVSLEADLFGPGALRGHLAMALSKRRRAKNGPGRLFMIESTPSLTGALADHRRAVRPSAIPALARQLAEAVKDPAKCSDPWLAVVARELSANRGRGLVIAGETQHAEVHAMAAALNESLGNVGQTVDYLPPPVAQPGIAALAAAMKIGAVETLFILGGNPIYDAPADLDFKTALAKVPLTIHHGLYADETADLCTWHIPESHSLESWSDTVAFDGSRSIVQPLIDPLYPSKSAHELLAALIGNLPTNGYEIVRAAWQQQHGEGDFETFWRKALHDGVAAPLEKPAATSAALPFSPAPETETRSLELIIRPDPHLLDGRSAENAWLQELPKPFTKLTWENAAELSPVTAQRLGLAHADVVDLLYHDRMITAPVWVLPGHADDCVTVHLGHGRIRANGMKLGEGFNAFALQTSDAPWGGPGLAIRKTAKRHTFATTQEHQRMDGREPVRVEKLGGAPEVREPAPAADETLYPKVAYSSPSWGMVIDLNACLGCSACTIACQAENNIPVVGREQVMLGREMHWIRVDTYHAGSAETPQTYHQPVPCMHCENAPCEVVCPVGATVHDHEGLNVMVYNRCVGTRYCSNNCPYKVRRFNFLAYNDTESPQLKLMRNPEVSVRMRGVMEKCSYCVQRISAARIEAEKESRPIRDGEVTPACAQACPGDAIVFGDIADPQSRVTAARQSPRHYALLAELNTRPRTTYLARVRNPHPEIAES